MIKDDVSIRVDRSVWKRLKGYALDNDISLGEAADTLLKGGLKLEVKLKSNPERKS